MFVGSRRQTSLVQWIPGLGGGGSGAGVPGGEPSRRGESVCVPVFWRLVCFACVRCRVTLCQGRRALLGPALALLPVRGGPACEAAVLSLLLLYADDPALAERAELLAALLSSSSPGGTKNENERNKSYFSPVVLARAVLLLATVLRAPSLQNRGDALWSQLNPVGGLLLFGSREHSLNKIG